MDAPAYFTEKATQCRRLATSITDDAAEKVLLALAEKYEALAAEYASREDSAKKEGFFIARCRGSAGR